jgi:hypothetical protein
MEPITQGVVASLLANGLTALVEASMRPVKESTTGPSDLRAIVQRSATKLATSLEEFTCGKQHKDRVVRFLVSNEVESFLQKLFLNTSIVEADRSTKALRREFSALYKFIVDSKTNEADASKLFSLLLTACEGSLKAAIEEQALAAHEALATLRDRRIHERLNAIEQNILFLRGSAISDVEVVERFLIEYFPLVAKRYGFITPQSFDRQVKIPINELFVSPRILSDWDWPNTTDFPHGHIREAPPPMPMEKMIRRINRTVLLGNPGGGKTTFAQKLTYQLATSPDVPVVAGRRTVPFFVTLREFAALKMRQGVSILEFVERKINSDLQLSVPSGVIEYLLRTGRAITVFDGLDELLDTFRRREISSDVESFATRFADAAVLVTSREIGYEQAPLDESQFQVYRVAPFNELEAQQYVKKWFSAVPDLAARERDHMAKSFLQGVKEIPDLLKSPLMLSLLCVLYRRAGVLPRNRPGIYSKCAELMFERWDEHRDIPISVPYRAHLFYAIQELAHWIYTEDLGEMGVNEGLIVGRTKRYLAQNCTDDLALASAAARDFVSFCQGRAWVFTDTGTDADGERLYSFTHRTFLEYFTAAYLVRNARNVTALAEELLVKVSEGSWDVVAQLAFHIQDQARARSADEMMLIFLDSAANSGSIDKAFRIYAFLVQCLQFLVPRPTIRRQIVKAFLEDWLAIDYSDTPDGRGLERSEWLGVFLHLVDAAEENRSTVLASIKEEIEMLFTVEDRDSCSFRNAIKLSRIEVWLDSAESERMLKFLTTQAFTAEFFESNSDIFTGLSD